MKKFVISLFAIGYSLLASSTVLAGSAILSLDPSSSTFNQGCGFPVNVYLDTGGARTDGTDAIINYDSSRFTATSITNGTIYPDYPGNNIDEATGKITVSGLASVNAPFSGKGVLATLNFTVKDTVSTGSTQITFEFDPQNKTDTRDSNVVTAQQGTVIDELNSVVNGNYIIGSGTCGAQSTPPPAGSGINKGGLNSTPAGQIKTIDQIVDQTGRGPGTPQLTFTLAIFGAILTVLGILGLALL